MRYALGSKIDPQEFARLAELALREGDDCNPLGDVERVYADDEVLVVLFSGEPHDSRGPFAARIPLPATVGDDEWQAHTESNAPSQWIAFGVVVRLVEEYQTLDELMWQRDPSGRLELLFSRSEAPSEIARAAWLREYASQTDKGR